ncbi:MAG: putative 4-hydroxybenzoate polyprenyltransferase [Bacteroidetes bacterium]|nr:putative 4-hydroxybenzoate polyprenyltransferase [Bacteroidota bacterium]
MKSYLSLVKFSHTLFALPFALSSFTIAATLYPDMFQFRLLLLVLACMVLARNAAMGFNRYLDRHIDALNPRTRQREIPAGVISPESALAFVVINGILFMVCSWFINRLCFALSPVALLVILGYSYTKRFTWMCHLVLGLGLALAPIGAYLAITGQFAMLPVLLGVSVLCWVAGFDVIYALQDVAFDQEQQLYSMPSFFGRKQALRISEFLHLASAVFLIYALWLLHAQTHEAGWLSWVAGAIFLGLLLFQHSLVKVDDLKRVNLAFFTTNGVASVIFGVLTIADLTIHAI